MTFFQVQFTGMSFLNNDASLPSCSISQAESAFIRVKLNLRLKGEHSFTVMNYVDLLNKEKPTNKQRKSMREKGRLTWTENKAIPGHTAHILETLCAGRPLLTEGPHEDPTQTPGLHFPTK